MSESNTELALRQQLEESLEEGSLKQIARDADNVMMLIDTSSSMAMTLRNGKRRIDALREVVANLAAGTLPPMIAFGGSLTPVRFVDGVPEPAGGTPLVQAILLAKEHGATRLVVISDGEPSTPDLCLTTAQEFGGRIDVSFVGTPGEFSGEKFLAMLAQATGGTQFNGDLGDPKQLTGQIIGLLNGEVEETRLQGEGFTSVDPDDIEDAEDLDDEDDEDDDEDEDDEE